MTKKQRRKLNKLVRTWKGAAKNIQATIDKSRSDYDHEYYQGQMLAFSSCAHYLEQFLEGK